MPAIATVPSVPLSRPGQQQVSQLKAGQGKCDLLTLVFCKSAGMTVDWHLVGIDSFIVVDVHLHKPTSPRTRECLGQRLWPRR